MQHVRAPSHQPTILQIIPRLEMGGAERTVVEMSAAITAAGGRALVASQSGRMADAVRAAGGEIIEFPAATKNPARIVANVATLLRLIGAEKIDLLHARSRAPAWTALLAARRAGLPLVTTYHGGYSEKNAFKRLYNGVMARADTVIANSDYTARMIRERYGTEEARIAVIHRGIDPAAYDPARIAPERCQALRDAWGITADTRVILHPARLSNRKGQTVVIDAAARLGLGFSGASDARGPVAVILAGDAQGRGEYVETLRSRIRAHRLEAVVKLVGHTSDMAAAYALSTVALIASTEPEAFGRTSIEAQAAGTPMIVGRLGAPPETVRAQPDAPPGTETGWIVPPGDADALAGALAEALALTVEERAAWSSRSRLHATRNFTLQRLQCQTLAVYDALLKTRLEANFSARTA